MYYNKTHTDTNMEDIMAVIDKSKALDTALAQIEKQFGKGAVMRLGQEDALQVASNSDRFSVFGSCPWHRRFAQR